MDNFDLREYLAEGRLLKEEFTPSDLQQYVYDYEKEVSGEDEANGFLDGIKNLNTPQDVYDYYAIDRGWEGSDLENISKQVKRKFANLISTDSLTPLQRRAYSYAKERFGNDEAKKSLDQIKTFKTDKEFTDWVYQKIEIMENFDLKKYLVENKRTTTPINEVTFDKKEIITSVTFQGVVTSTNNQKFEVGEYSNYDDMRVTAIIPIPENEREEDEVVAIEMKGSDGKATYYFNENGEEVEE